MKRLKLKLGITIILAVAVTLTCFFTLRFVSEETAREYRVRQRSQRLRGIDAILENLQESWTQGQKEYENARWLEFELQASVLREYVKEGEYTGPRLAENGAVCTVRDGEILWPEGMPVKIDVSPEVLTNEDGIKWVTALAESDRKKFEASVLFERLTPDTFLVSWDALENELNYLETDSSMQTVLQEIGKIYDGCLAAFEDGWLAFLSDEEFFPQNATMESLGLSEDVSVDHPGILKRNSAEGEEPWYYVPVKSDILYSRKAFFFFQLKLGNAASAPDFDGQALTVAAILGLISIGLIVWLISIQKLVRDSILDADQYQRYMPVNIRRLTLIFSLIGCVVAVAAAIVTNSIDSLRVELARSSELLDRVGVVTDWLEERRANYQTARTEIVLRNARVVRDSLEANPAMMTREKLEEINSLFGSEYIIVYDHAGREKACSTDYTDFTLGKDETDEMYTFRRLTMGVESIVEPPREYEIVGKELQKIGVRLKLANGYGALIFALDPKALEQESVNTTHAYILRAATQEDCFSFAADQASGEILYASNSDIVGENVAAYGLTETLSGNSSMCEATIDNVNHYGVSVSHGDKAYFYFFNSSFLNRKLIPFIWYAAGFALLLCLSLGLTLHAGYTRKAYDILSQIGAETIKGRTVEIVTADGRRKRTVDPHSRWMMSGLKWKRMLPEQKTKLALQISLVLLAAGMLIGMNSGGFWDSSLIRYITAGNWRRGLNLFAVGKTILTIFGTVLVMLVLRMVVLVACQSVGTKGETVMRMLYNLLQYIAAFTLLYYTFENFGLETNALLGAMGAVTLAVSLGAKDIMADILAGMNIVVEGEYQVGDIVEINKVKGKVMDIGVRTTKILCQGDNVKIINNRFINDVVNMTRFNSWYGIEVTVSSNVEVAEMEKVLQRELPAMNGRIPNIISGPVYKGIESFGKGTYNILILAECREENLNNVHRNLNREIRLLLEREKILLN